MDESEPVCVYWLNYIHLSDKLHFVPSKQPVHGRPLSVTLWESFLLAGRPIRSLEALAQDNFAKMLYT